MECPKCHGELHDGAKFCGCGWKRGSAPVASERVPCAHDGCGIAAMCKIKTETGWANLCWQHYDAHFAEQGRKNSERLGLKTGAEHRAWMRENMKKFPTMAAFDTRAKADRQPGEDEDYAYRGTDPR